VLSSEKRGRENQVRGKMGESAKLPNLDVQEKKYKHKKPKHPKAN
jgi:hypothetical protein